MRHVIAYILYSYFILVQAIVWIISLRCWNQPGVLWPKAIVYLIYNKNYRKRF